MHLSPREIDKLLLHNAGFLAQKRLARGVRLNHPESVALIATNCSKLSATGISRRPDGLGRRFLGRNQVMPGVPEMIAEVQVEGTFPDPSSSPSTTPSALKTAISSSPFTGRFSLRAQECLFATPNWNPACTISSPAKSF